ncbi:MAG TPA: hypothetical protein VFS25_06465, partial [Chitinophaga sp.]|uniref:hypothetical protein n=1 Tax=Chitinophaga sp. TaxID=1869181 RepID=UPI002DB9E99F
MQLRYYWLLVLLLNAGMAAAQKNEPKGSLKDFIQVYPVGDDADINVRTSYVKYEKVLFEANPIVRYSFANNIMQGLGEDKHHVRAYYAAFTPQVRMYTDNSLPVKTPSYRILLGTQQVFRFGNNLFTIALESGHYSN